MTPQNIKKHIAMCLGAFGGVTLTLGFLLENDAWMVIGLMHLIAASFWAYGQTLHKP